MLVEPLASQRGGHPARSLPLLAAAAARVRRPLVVVAANGVDDEVRASLEAAGTQIIFRPRRPFSPAAVMVRAARLSEACYDFLHPRFPSWQLPHQLRLLSRCLIEAGSLRIGLSELGPDAALTAVVLTANLTLHAAAAALGGVPHVRYLHDLSRDESRMMRVLEWVFARGTRRIHVLCTTEAVQKELRRRYPRIASSVQTYALDDPTARLENPARERARDELGLANSPRPIGSLIGGWWLVKDMTTVAHALSEVRQPFTLLVAGYRINTSTLDQVASRHRGELRVLDGELNSAELSQVYATSDFTIVSRTAGGKESGVALDAVSRGVPLVISDHDPSLVRKLEGQSWARVFRCGDPGSLARALDQVCEKGLPRPPADATARVGMLRADQMLDAFDRAAAAIR